MKTGAAGALASQFMQSKLTPLLMVVFLLVGFYAAYLTPREEEPQIEVPFADIFLRYPGASAEEVESRIVDPLEKIIANIEGVEYIYSTSRPGEAMLIVRYYVGADIERAYVRLYNEIVKHMDKMPQRVSMPLIKTRSIDDVPVLGLTLWSEDYTDFELRRIAEELNNELEKVDNVGATNLHGGRSRKVQVVLQRDKMASYSLDILSVAEQLEAANQQQASGGFNAANERFLVETGNFLHSAEEVGQLVIGVQGRSPVYLHQIAEIEDGPEEPAQYVTFGYGGAAGSDKSYGDHPAVTLSIAKTKGADAMQLAEKVQAKLDILQQTLIPENVHVEVTRNYGQTASHKVSELLLHLLGSIVAVTIVVTLSMGFRGGLVVFLSVPVTFALTLLVYYLLGYTLNRITLFALVFVTGIVVDDSIIIAENMHRHFRMRRLPFKQAALASIDEVGNPTILATFTVISAVLPMVFVSGLMGPYMSPMPIGASFAMIFSLLVALIVTPFLAYHLLKGDKSLDQETGDTPQRIEETSIYRLYSRLMNPLLASSGKRWAFIGIVVVLLGGSVSLLYFRLLEVKMLPFDNKNEFQVIVDMPEGTPLEKTYTVSKEIAAYLQERPEVVDYQAYTGAPAPINFNGLVRHYDLRRGPHMADIQVNLKPKEERDDQSHAIAKRLRPEIQKIASRYGANVKVVEVPPGPPVMSTLVAEVYGPDLEEQGRVAAQIKTMFEEKEGVVDVDWRVEADQKEYEFSVDKEEAMLNGITTVQVVEALNMALDGRKVGRLYRPEEVEEVDIQLRLEEEDRSGLAGLKGIRLRNQQGQLIPLGDVVRVEETRQDKSIHHKNQKRVTYVTADVAGAIESPVYAILDFSERLDEIDLPPGYQLTEHYTQSPFTEEEYGLKWDGEWHITYEVFRDLGGAFAVVLVVIYMLIIGWFQDFKVPLVMMVAIPLSLVGILPGHWALGAFFTATSMIGMIALAGIMVRNSVLLIDFIQLQLKGGSSLRDAVLEAGAVRTTPILLTAGTVVIGAFVILFDPIFQGLAISLMGGSIASTVLTLLIVPLIYFMTEKGKYGVDTPDPMGHQKSRQVTAGATGETS